MSEENKVNENAQTATQIPEAKADSEVIKDSANDPKGDPGAMKIDMKEPGFDLNPLENGSDFIRKRFAVTPEGTPEEVAASIISKLTKEGKEVLLRNLVEREVLKLNKSITPSEYMNERNPDPNGYPYLHGYSRKLYRKQLAMLQVELIKLESWVKQTGQKVAILLEGRDAAGKDETIARFMKNMDPHGARVAVTPVPTQQEQGQWFFQRYVAKLPSPGEIVFFDRSWYNRAVVDPVLGFCTQEQTDLFLKEVPHFERSLINAGIILIKFWLDVGREEQKHRFKLREYRPLKSWQLSAVDLASGNKWDQYSDAIEKMFQTTNSYPAAPWTVVRTDDKFRGRLNAIRYVLLHLDYPNKDGKAIGKIDPLIVYPASQYLTKGVGMVKLEEKEAKEEVKEEAKKNADKHHHKKHHK